jgi:hypothetical protein
MGVFHTLVLTKNRDLYGFGKGESLGLPGSQLVPKLLFNDPNIKGIMCSKNANFLFMNNETIKSFGNFYLFFFYFSFTFKLFQE